MVTTTSVLRTIVFFLPDTFTLSKRYNDDKAYHQKKKYDHNHRQFLVFVHLYRPTAPVTPTARNNTNSTEHNNNKIKMVRRRRYADATVARVAEDFEKLGFRIRRGGIVSHFMAPRLHDRRFREMFGCSSIVCANAWMYAISRNKN